MSGQSIVAASCVRRGRRYNHCVAVVPLVGRRVPVASVKGTSLQPWPPPVPAPPPSWFQSPSRRGRRYNPPLVRGVSRYTPFQSPSRRGRRYNLVRKSLDSQASRFQSPSRRGRRYNGAGMIAQQRGAKFQSPSRRGRRYNLTHCGEALSSSLCFSPLREGDAATTRGGRGGGRSSGTCFSPLREGDAATTSILPVSVRLRIGFSPLREGDAATTGSSGRSVKVGMRFSPLREGDAATTGCLCLLRPERHRFQSPSRRGRRYNRPPAPPPTAPCCVSVPFAKGTPLQRISPGLCPAFRPVSVPFAKGTPLQRAATVDWGVTTACFSPLREGDAATTLPCVGWGNVAVKCFSPLREGDAATTAALSADGIAQLSFSPLREGDAATTGGWVESGVAHEGVSVPFAKGTPLQLESRN